MLEDIEKKMEGSLLISLFFLIMIPKSSRALFVSIFDGGITMCCHGVGFSFSGQSHTFKKETLTLLLCKHHVVLLHPQKVAQQYCKKVNILIR